MGDVKKNHMMNDGIKHTRNLILRGMSAIYLIAFLSFYYQSPGLFGNNGVLPSRLQIESAPRTLWSRILRKPTLLHFASYCGLDTEYMIDVLALLGSLVSFVGFVSQKLCILPTFTILWLLYYSLMQVAQTFINQSDYLLLEAGFIMILLAPLMSPNQSGPSDKIMFVLLRWLVMRFLFASCVVKFFRRCPHTWNFTAFNHHFETMPLPTTFAWYVHNYLPAGWLKITNMLAGISELGLVWLFFFPHRAVRRYVFYWQVFLQFNTVLSGNFGFLNFLLPVLMLSLLDDTFITKQNFKRALLSTIKILLISYLLLLGVCFTMSSPLAGVKFEEKYLEILSKSIRPAPLIAAFVVISTFLVNLVSHPTITKTRSFVQKIYGVNTLISFSVIALSMVIVSMVPHGNLNPATNLTNTDAWNILSACEKFHIVNEYGQHTRKMRSERHEILYEFADDVDGPWMEYEFLYKPCNVNVSLPLTGPCLARLDHKLYDASFATYRQELWTISLAYRLLQGQRNVIGLLGGQSSLSPPNYVRATLYKFRYTTQFDSIKGYWIREKLTEYFPAFTVDNESLLAHLKSIKISPHYREIEVKNQLLKSILEFVRSRVRLLEGNLLILAVFVAGFTIIITKHKISNV